MDDPWGSPWATADSDKDQKTASPAKSDVALPPRAFLSASNSPRIPAIVEQSPWPGDEDGFGDWATASETPPAQTIWGGGWGVPSPNLLSTPRSDVLDKTSPIAWPGNVATSRLVNGSPGFRQPSPDPWASGNSSRRESHDGFSTPRLVVDAPSPVEAPVDALEKDGLGIESGVVWDQSDTAGAHGNKHTEKLEPISHDTEGAAAAEDRAVFPSKGGSDVRLSVDSAPQGHEDRSTSPSNEHTDHEDERPDSPTTSLDEEPRKQAPGSRKTSGKVQELVVKFDGLARAASEERVPISRARSRSPLSVRERDAFDEAADFGDFEDADENELPPPPEIPASEPATEASDLVAKTSTSLPTQAPDPPSKAWSPINRFGPLNFGVDLTLVTKLFELPPELTTRETGVDSDLPDHVISDSFTEISERKTWYRVSRLGSSRRHNAADDESYRRVAWPTSTVHHDAIKIVRRWMEEDSIAGRVALGGGISKTQKNMFGWDSSAEPVALDAVFGKKKSHTRAASLQPIQIAGPPSDASNGFAKKSLGSTHRPSGSAGPAIASFGWSSTSPASTGQPITLGELGQPLTPNTTGPASETIILASQARDVSQPTVHQRQPSNFTCQVGRARPASAGNIVTAEEEDDEEWGEMIASPTTIQPMANNSAAQAPPTIAVSNLSIPNRTTAIDGRSLDKPVVDDPWSEADFSVYDSAPSKTASSDRAAAPMPGVAKYSAERPTSTSSMSESPVDLSTISTGAPTGPSALTRTQQTLSPPTSQGLPNIPIGDMQSQHDEAALAIIANLPDLSYMLR